MGYSIQDTIQKIWIVLWIAIANFKDFSTIQKIWIVLWIVRMRTLGQGLGGAVAVRLPEGHRLDALGKAHP
jgi:hypothetical protein